MKYIIADFFFSQEFIFAEFNFYGSWEDPQNSRKSDSEKILCHTVAEPMEFF